MRTTPRSIDKVQVVFFYEKSPPFTPCQHRSGAVASSHGIARASYGRYAIPYIKKKKRRSGQTGRKEVLCYIMKISELK